MRILMVCLGNICRSPTAEAALREAAADAGMDVEIDSAGLGAWHVGNPPDARMRRAAADEGLHIDGRARQVTADELDDWDLVLAMDRSNLEELRRLAPDVAARGRLRLFRDFADAPGQEVPDPYYGGPDGFREVVGIARAGARGIVDAIARGDL